MLTEERFAEILRMLGEEKSVTVQELTERLATSESTIRRDLTALAEKGLLVKVHGGATALEMDYTTKDVEITSRMTQNVDEKSLIGKYAASLIEKEDFVYLDSGSSIAQMLKYMTGSGAVFVTNGIAHAQSLTKKGITVYLEAMIKKAAMERCRTCYILADSSKIGQIAPVTFAKFDQAKLITTELTDKDLKKEKNIVEVKA